MKQIEIDKRVKKLAKHANGPLGRIPLERVFEKHVSFLEELREFGATWGQIAQLLFTHGITQKSGNILQANQVRVAFTRVQKKLLNADTPHQKGKSPPLQPVLKEVASPRKELSEGKPNPHSGRTKPIASTKHGSDIRRRMAQSLKVRK